MIDAERGPDRLTMTYFDCWIAEPESVPSLLGDDRQLRSGRQGNTRNPMFPDGRRAFFVVRDGIASGKYRGIQVDALTWATLMTRAEILSLLAELFGPPGDFEARHAGPLHHLAKRMTALRAFVTGLPEGQAVRRCRRRILRRPTQWPIKEIEASARS